MKKVSSYNFFLHSLTMQSIKKLENYFMDVSLKTHNNFALY